MEFARYRWLTWSLSLQLILQLIGGLVAWANPSHKRPDAPLAVHGRQSSAAWHQQASRLYAEASKKLLAFLEKEQQNAVKNIGPDDLGQTYLMITTIDRYGEWMEIWGEPAGVDFRLRSGVMRPHLDRLVNQSRSLPATQKYMENFRLQLAKSAAARAKALTNLQKLSSDQKWEAAESLLWKLYDSLEPGMVFLDPAERKPIYEPFHLVEGVIRAAMLQQRTAAAAKEIGAAMQELSPDYRVAIQEMGTAVDTVEGGGSTIWRGETVTGPQFIERIGKLWREIQVRALQHRAKSWALGAQPGYLGVSLERTHASAAEGTDSHAASYAKFSELVKALIVRLVAADGARMTAEELRHGYVEYLRSLAPLVRQSNDRHWATQLEASLSKFQGKDPAFDQEIDRYAAATNDLLRWRARAAAAQVAANASEFAPVSQRFRDATLSGKTDGMNSDYTGLFAAPPATTMQPQLLTDSADIMPIAIQRLIGQKATAADVVRIAADSKWAIARYSDRTYVNVPAPLPLAAEVEALRTDLFISEQTPPLTLMAMQAISTAERGDLVAVGGELSGCYLEAVVTRFATLPTEAVAVTRLGELPAESFDSNRLQQMLMRFELTPQWACHDYFFLDLKSSGR